MTTLVRPRQPDQITPEWLTAVLAANGHDGVVASLRTHPVGEGVGMMGVICRVEIDYAQGSGPASVIAKFPTLVEANLGVATTFDVYRRELRFYSDLGPRSGVRLPKVYFNECPATDDFTLVMEDLSAYHLGDQLRGCSLEQAAVCMDELARLHGSFWGAVDSEEFEFVPYHSPSFHATGMHQAAMAGWDKMLAVFTSRVPQHMVDVKDRYFAAVPAMQAWIASAPITLVHGDFRLDNLLFSSGPDVEVAVLDWQGVLRSRGVQDVAYLLSHSMDVELRREHERDLVQRWQAGLAPQGVTGYSVADAWEDYRRAVLYLWVYVVVIAGALDANNDRGLQWMGEMIARSGAAIADLGGLDLLDEFPCS